ncbi:MAG: beta-lactamase family protein [Gemmatimonadota bacterium]|nr:MAG: beta-lactamase family protein [Gemmatimonadota bacterium]
MKRLIGALAFLGAVTGSAGAQTPAPGAPLDTAALAGRLRALADSASVPGGAVVVARNGRVDAIIALGTRNETHPVTEETVFRIASVSKVFTAAAAARLVALGELSLDADLRTDRPWLAAVASGPEPVTLRGLLTHTAGFDDRAIGMFVREAEDVTPLGDYLRAHMPHRTTVPGRWARYTNQGVALAGLVVEETAGQPFDAAVAALILEPLDMVSSSFAQPLSPALTDRLACAYRCTDAGCDPVPWDYRNTSLAGGLVTTPADMGRFMLAVLDEGHASLGAETVRLLTSRAWSAQPDMPGLALALFEQPIAGYRGLVHAGASSGYLSLLVLVPDAGAGLFVVTTGGSSRFGAAVLAEFEHLLGAAPGRSGSPPAPLTAEELDEYSGVYLLGRAARRGYESMPGRFLYSSAIGSNADGYLTRSEAGRVRRYGRVEDDLFADVDGIGMMAFERNPADRVVAVHAADVFNGARFPASYERLPGVLQPRFINELLSWAAGLPTIALVVWLLIAGVGLLRRRPGRRGRTAMGKAGLLLAPVTTAIMLVFMFRFLARFNGMAMSDPVTLAYGLPPALERLLWLPWAIAACAVTLAGIAVASWRPKASVPFIDRALFAVTGACALLFVAVLVYFSLLPPVA